LKSDWSWACKDTDSLVINVKPVKNDLHDYCKLDISLTLMHRSGYLSICHEGPAQNCKLIWSVSFVLHIIFREYQESLHFKVMTINEPVSLKLLLMYFHCYWRNRKHVCMLCAVIKHAGICQNTREVLRNMTRSGVLLNTFQLMWQIPKSFITARSTVDKFSISFIKYKSLRSFGMLWAVIKHVQQPISLHVIIMSVIL
jgi:hypothetical protein